MPELPEVQTVVNELIDANLIGQTIQHSLVHWERTVLPNTVPAFKAATEGQTIAAIRRRAKYICIDLQNGTTLWGHLRMSGRLYFTKRDEAITKHEHLVFRFADQDLRFHDTRKFGRWYVADSSNSPERKLGVEPLSDDFTKDGLTSLCKSSRRIKPLLLDQSKIVGLGNIYVDEALWRARIHPETPAHRISAQKRTVLFSAIPEVLRIGLRNMGTSLGTGAANFYSVANRSGRNADELQVFRRDGQPCPRCATMIVKKVVAGRSSHFCPKCQVLPAPKKS